MFGLALSLLALVSRNALAQVTTTTADSTKLIVMSLSVDGAGSTATFFPTLYTTVDDLGGYHTATFEPVFTYLPTTTPAPVPAGTIMNSEVFFALPTASGAGPD